MYINIFENMKLLFLFDFEFISTPRMRSNDMYFNDATRKLKHFSTGHSLSKYYDDIQLR